MTGEVPNKSEDQCPDPGVAYVGWRIVRDFGEWVQMRSGAGEAGWWHRHADAPHDFGANPVDGDFCRTCGKVAAMSGGSNDR